MSRMTLRRAALLAGLALMTVAPAAMAGDPDVVVRTGQAGYDLRIRDVSALGGTVLVGWDELGGVGAKGGLASSADAAATFYEWLAVTDYASPRVDACLTPLERVAVLGHPGTGDDRAMSLFATSQQRQVIESGTDYLRPDIACVNDDLVVLAVLVRKPGGTRLTIWTFKPDLTDGAAFGFDLGPASKGSGPVIVANGGWVHVAWMSGRSLKYKRFAVGSGPGYALSPKPTVVIETARGQGQPQLGVDGKRVVLAWERGADVVARVSADRGAAFGTRKTVFAGDRNSSKVAFLDSADVRGSTFVIASTSSSEGISFRGHVMRSTNNGRTWAKVPGTTHTGGYLFAALDGPAGAPILHLVRDQRFSGIETQVITATSITLP